MTLQDGMIKMRSLALVLAAATLVACGGGGNKGSGGSASDTVPNVVGSTQAAATTAITSAGLKLGTVTMQSSATVTSGAVISESPAAGTSAASGSAVNLTVSSGPAMVAVPNVVGKTQVAATTAITGAGLTLGTVTMQSSATVASGNVISESPAAGTSVAGGSAVNLVVSSGAATSSPTLGGIVIGLTSGVTAHVLNGSDNVPVSANGSFTFPTALASGASYSVSVGMQPTGQTCAVQNASGTAGSANITNVVVYCTFNVSAATLTGTYEIAAYDISGPNDGLFTETFDGTGNRSGTGTTNTNTTIATGVADSGAYVVAPNAAQIPVLTDSGNNIGGILGANGDVAITLNHTANGMQPAMAVAVKPLTTATIASLTGTYVGASVTSASPLYGSLGTTTVNSDGSASQTGTNLSATGVPSTTSNSYPAGTFVVGSGGAISVGGSGGASGYLSADGNLVVLTYITGTNNFPGISVAIKQSNGLTAATFNGVYAVVALGGTSPSASVGLAETIYAHGDGTYTVDYTQNATGTVTTANTATGTYTVGAAGALVVTTQSGVSSSGQISADGNAIVLGDITSGEPPAVAVGVRQ
jgi:hypothetical protein